MDQQISSAAQKLENVVCKGLGIAQSGSVTRNIKVKSLKSNSGTPVSEELYSQAVKFFADRAPDPVAFQRLLGVLEHRGVRGLRETLATLHKLTLEEGLQVLTQGPFHADTALPQTIRPSPTAQPMQPASVLAPSSTSIPAATRPSALPAQPVSMPAAPMQPLQPPHISQGSIPVASERPSSNSRNSFPLPATAIAQSQPLQQHQKQQQQPPSLRAQLMDPPDVMPMDIDKTPAVRPPPVARQPVAVPAAPTPGPLEALAQETARTQPSQGLVQGLGQLPSPRFPEQHRPVGSVAGSLGGSLTSAVPRPVTPLGSGTPAPPQPRVAAPGDLFDLFFSAGNADLGAGTASEALLNLVPVWNTLRPHLTARDTAVTAAARADTRAASTGTRDRDPLEGVPPAAQEAAVMNDLLYAFMGVDGVHVNAVLCGPQGTAPGLADAPGARSNRSSQSVTQRLSGQQLAQQPGSGPRIAFTVRPCLEPCSLELVERLTPLCEYTAVLQRYVETRSTYEYGMVSHAVCAAVQQLLCDWQLVVTQLEHQLRLGRLTLQGMVYYCQGPLTTLGLVSNVVAEAASHKLSSAGLLNLLAAKVSALAGDQVGRNLMQKLLQAAMVPYFRLLERWLCEGVLEDPYGEFMIQENKSITKDRLTTTGELAYWSQRYTVRQCESVTRDGQQQTQPDVPDFLAPLTDKILKTGKYLNAIRECGQTPSRPLPASTRLSHTSPTAYAATIHEAHAAASSALLQLVLGQSDLLGWLRSLKHFFLLDQGDVVVHLAEAARDELAAPAAALSRPRLQSLLELAVRTSTLAQDAHADALQLDLDPRSLHDQAAAVTQPEKSVSQRPSKDVAGWQVVQLSVRLGWPLTLVVSPRALSQYQLIFKYLFQLKHTERQLATAWHRMQGARNAARSGRDGLRGAYSLAQRHLFLVQELLRYSTMDVLEPAWQTMEERVRRAHDLDEVIASHSHMLSAAVEGLLLAQPKVVQAILALQTGALAFSHRLLAAWDELDRQAAAQQQQQQPQQGRSSRGGAAGGSRVSVGGTDQSLASRRESRLERWSQSGPGTAIAQLDVEGLTGDLSSAVAQLLQGIEEYYQVTMKREAAADSAMVPQSLETREEVEALLGLMQRLQIDIPGMTAGAPRAAAGGATAAAGSTAALYQQLSAQAATMLRK